MASTTRQSKYSYRASSGGIADVNIEYSADLTALTRLEVTSKIKSSESFNVSLIYGWKMERKQNEIAIGIDCVYVSVDISTNFVGNSFGFLEKS